MNNFITKKEIPRTKLCRGCKKERDASKFTNHLCKQCWSRKRTKYFKDGKYVKQPPKMLKVIKDSSTTILSYNNAAALIGVSKDYLYVALSREIPIKGYKVEKC